MLAIIGCTGFIKHTPDRSFLANNFADFIDMRVKKSFLNILFYLQYIREQQMFTFFGLHYAREMIPVHLSCVCYNWACGFHVAYALQEFADFLDVQVKALDFFQ